MSKDTTSQSVAKGRTYGEVRCLNCYARIAPPLGTTRYTCPKCSYEWRISWPHPGFPRIRGPVWDVNRRLADQEEAEGKKKQS